MVRDARSDLAVTATSMDPDGSTAMVEVMLAAARARLGMDVAFVGEFRDGRRWLRFTDEAEGAPRVLVPGGSDPLEETYCQRIADRRLPRLVRDTGEHDSVRGLDATRSLPVGALVSVPVRFSDGRVYGTFCCFSRDPRPDLRGSDLAVVEMIAELVAPALERLDGVERELAEDMRRISATITSGGLATVFQPIVDFDSGRTVGYEALTRLADATPPDRWFSAADAVGLGADAEVAAVAGALSHLEDVPRGCYLSINVSPGVMVTDALRHVLSAAPLERVVLELTEHMAVEDYPELDRALERFRHAGGRLAVDDAGAGYASMRHILQLRPDLIKLDISICRDVEQDPVREAMVCSFVQFSRSIGAALVAEGVETDGGCETLRRLGVALGQGYLFARPGPLPVA